MSYEERKQAKIEYARNMVEKCRSASVSASEQSHNMVKHIPMGQPILVGHHSEKAHRNLLDRSWNKLGQSVKLEEKAEYYENKANNMENNTMISSDDPEAVTKLKDKLVKLENQRTQIKEYNKKARKEGKDSMPRYHLANLGGNVATVKKRIAYLEKLKTVKDSEQTFGDITLKVDKEDNRVRLIFPGKPSEEVRTKLKRNGFRWSPYNSAWQRQISDWSIHVAKEIATEVSE